MAGLEPASYEAPHIRLHSVSYLCKFHPAAIRQAEKPQD